MATLIGVAFVGFVQFAEPDHVYASGNGTFTSNITASAQQVNMVGQSAVAQYWADEVIQSTATTLNAGSVQTGIWMSTQTDKYYGLQRTALGFEISGFSENWTPTAARIYIKTNAKSDNTGVVAYYAFFRMANTNTTVETSDFDEAYNYAGAGLSDRVSSTIKYSDISASGWNTFTILSPDLEWISTPDANGYVWLQLATLHDMTNAQPTPWGSTKIQTVSFDTSATGEDIRLEIDYSGDVPTRTIVYGANDAFTGSATGNETTDNITWGSPRAGYADEGLLLQINGDAGALLDLDLMDSAGTTLRTQSAQIGDSGQWDFYYKLPDDYYGFVRLVENNSGVYSTWGYQMPEPDGDQIGNYVYAVSTEYPQYEYAFNRYLTYENDMFVLHWKTNVQAGEESTHSLKVWGNGDNVTQEHFNQTLEWINDNYWYANASNKYLSAWRYMIMTPNVEGTGFEDYDGLVYDIDVDYGSTTAGFLQAVIVDDTVGTVLADSHSCYWYIPTVQDGIIFNLNRSSYSASEAIAIQVQVGQACRAKTYLPSLLIEMLDESDDVLTSYSGGYNYGLNAYEVEAPATNGNYRIRFTFSGDPSWSYIHDELFSVGVAAPLTGGLVDNVSNWLSNMGMDNSVGWWVVLIVGMVLLFLVAYDSNILRVVLPLLFMGLMIVWGKIDIVIVILLIMGAGFTAWRLFRKQTGGSDEG